MNIYSISTVGYVHYGHVLPTAEQRVVAQQDIDWYVNEVLGNRKGLTVTRLDLVSTSTDCAGCGHSWNDHFNGSGLCSLGFCTSHCGEFVPTL